MGFAFATETKKDQTVDSQKQQFQYKSKDKITQKKGYEFSIVYGKINEKSKPDPSCQTNFQGNGGTGQGQLTYTEQNKISYQHAGLLIEVFNGAQMTQFLIEVTYVNYTQAIVWMRPFDYERFPNKKEFLFCVVLDQFDVQNQQIRDQIEQQICDKPYDYNTIKRNSQDFVFKTRDELINYFQQQNFQVIYGLENRIKKD